MKRVFSFLWKWFGLAALLQARARTRRLAALEAAARFWTAEAEREYVAAMRAYNVGDTAEGMLAKERYRVAMRRLERDVMEPLARELQEAAR